MKKEIEPIIPAFDLAMADKYGFGSKGRGSRGVLGDRRISVG